MISFITLFIVSILNAGLGIYVLSRGLNKPNNIAYFIMALSISMWTFSFAVSFVSKDALFWIRVILFSGIFIPPSFIAFAKTIDAGNEKYNKWEIVIHVIIIAILLRYVTTSYFVDNVSIEEWGLKFTVGPFYLLGGMYYTFGIIYGMFIVAREYLIKKSIKKIQAQYILLAAILGGIFGLLFAYILPSIGFVRLSKYSTLASVIVLASFAYAITKHRLMEISIVISRTIAQILCITLLSIIYIGMVWLYRNYISANIDYLFIILTVIYGLIIGQINQKIRLFIQTTSDKVFLRGKYDYYKELAEISSQITRTLSIENIIRTLQKAFYDVIEVSNHRIYLQADFARPEIAAYLSIDEPTIKADELILPCLLEKRTIAIIILGKKLSEDPYTDDDLRLLRVISNQTAIALDHQRIYEQSLKTRKQLLAADRISSLGRMAASLAHEIKNPLAAIKGMSQMLGQNVNDPEFIADFKQVVPKEISRLENLVDNLLKLGKTNKEGLQIVNIDRLIEDVLKLYDNCLKHKGIKLVKELNPISEIKADPEQLAQVLTNLILNAIQAMPYGGVLKIKTQASKRKDKEAIIIEVSDNGVGIPDSNIKNIFEPFYSSKEDGIGLGLAISYKIVKDHGGEIEVESKIGEGTIFRVSLPY